MLLLRYAVHEYALVALAVVVVIALAVFVAVA